MAYVLGFMYADGSVENAPAMRGKYIRVACTDRDIVESIRFLMESEHNIVRTKKTGKYKDVFLLRIGSKKLFFALNELGVTERKSLSLKFPLVPTEFLTDFIRGYFDGDGCAHIERSNEGKLKRLTTVFTSGSFDFLQELQKHLHEIAHLSNTKKIYKTKGQFSSAYQLRYSTRDSIKLYKLIYPNRLSRKIFLKRKYDIFRLYFEERGITKKNIEMILQTNGPLPI